MSTRSILKDRTSILVQSNYCIFSSGTRESKNSLEKKTTLQTICLKIVVNGPAPSPPHQRRAATVGLRRTSATGTDGIETATAIATEIVVIDAGLALEKDGVAMTANAVPNRTRNLHHRGLLPAPRLLLRLLRPPLPRLKANPAATAKGRRRRDSTSKAL